MAKKIKKGQSGFSSAGVLDDSTLDIIPDLMGNVKRPNLMGDPTKLGTADLGPLLAMMAAGAYPAVSAMTDKEGKLRDRGVIVPPQDPLTEEEKKRLRENVTLPVDFDDTTLITPPSEKIDTSSKTIPPKVDTKTPGLTTPEVEDMSVMTMADQSKALVPTKMMESFEDLPNPKEFYKSDVAPRFSQTEDYIKSNYTGNEKKLINDWVNELFNPQKGLTLELRDTGIAAQLEQLNQADPKRKVTAKELLEVVQAADNQLAGFGNYRIMGEDQELFPQVVQKAINDISNMDIIIRPGPMSEFMERYKDLVASNLNAIKDSRNRGDAADGLANIQVLEQQLLNEEGIDKSFLERNREYGMIQDYIRQVGQTLQGTVFTNEHMSIGLPGTRAEDYSVITHNFNPKFGQDSRTSSHNTSHPTADNTVAFSRARKIQNYINGDQGTVIMEMQSDIHRDKPMIEYPTSANDFTSSKNNYPYAGGAQYWVKQVLKDRLTQALIDGDDFLGWVPGEVVSHYEGADNANYKGFINIYNNKTNEFIKRINKDITKRGKALGLSDEEIAKATLKVKNDGQYKFDRAGDDYFARVRQNEFPGMEKYVKSGEKEISSQYRSFAEIARGTQEGNTLQLVNMPYIDLKPREDFDPELLKKIGLPQFKKGGKTKSTKADPLIDIEIFFESV